MNSFTQDIHIFNKYSMINVYNSIILNYLREDIFNHIIKRKYKSDGIVTTDLENIKKNNEIENDYFDFGNFKNKRNISENISENIQTIKKELHELGWKTCLGFGDTVMFIYSTEEKPSSCW